MNVCFDACFLIGLYDTRDQHHEKSKHLFESLFEIGSPNVAVIVWPVLYESVSTQLVRHQGRTAEMERDWRRLISARQLVFLDDQPYRDDALELCLKEIARPRATYRSLSLTDRVLRAVLADTNVRVDCIITFNQADFVDVCRTSGRHIVS
jgi:predicted nucleic acid-binding protein